MKKRKKERMKERKMLRTKKERKNKGNEKEETKQKRKKEIKKLRKKKRGWKKEWKVKRKKRKKRKKCSFPFAERNCGYEEECVAEWGAAGYLIERQMKMKNKRSEKKRRVVLCNLHVICNLNDSKTPGKKKQIAM